MPEHVLIGREAECRAIDDLLGMARGGQSATLLLRGEAGIGKTALLGYAARQATDMLALSARGVESESEISFSGLSELVRPLLDRIGSLPAPQAAAIASALAIGPPIAGDRFAVAAAALSLLASAAASGPVLVIIDDLQWLDTSSAEAVLFAARRLDAEPIAMLFAARDESHGQRSGYGVPERRIHGLDRESSLALLRSSTPSIGQEVAERLFRETGGNPLALVEIPPLIPASQLAGHEPLDAPLRVTERIEQAFAKRIDGLPADAQSALLVSAASESRSVEVIAAALRELGLTTAALETAETAGLVALDGGELAFRHPLVRSCVYYGATSAQLRSSHGALARALEGRGEEAADQRAWHHSASSLEPDETIAQALEDAALRARRRSGYPAAARTFERAARSTPAIEARARRLFQAADAWHLANQSDRAVALLEEAATLTLDPFLRAEVQHLRGRIDSWRGPAIDAYRMLCREADAIETSAPEKAAMMLSDATLAAITGGDLPHAVAAATRAHELALPLGGAIELISALQLGKALILTGQARAGYPLIMRCAELFDPLEPLDHGDEVAQCAPALLAVEEYGVADGLLARVIAAGRQANALGLLTYCLGAQAELDVRTGRWSQAYANGFESVHLAREADRPGQLSYNLARLARLEAALGREEACRAHVSEALELASGLDFGSTFPFAASALGLLELSLGRLDAAIQHLSRTNEHWDRIGLREPGRLEWQADLVEALVRAGRRDEAEPVLDDLERHSGAEPASDPIASAWTGPFLTRAAARRCRGLLAAEGDIDREFQAAFDWHAQTTTPFELARTELCYGEQLRRHGRRVDARRQLRTALETFDRLGAVPWSRRARAELAATGETVRASHAAPAEQLTSQELQVALIVAGGATNKEAGAALFLTPKTIEFHLAKIYRKLDLRSRTELARRFADRAAPPMHA